MCGGTSPLDTRVTEVKAYLSGSDGSPVSIIYLATENELLSSRL